MAEGNFESALPFSQVQSSLSLKGSVKGGIVSPKRPGPLINSTHSHEDAVHGIQRISAPLLPLCASAPFTRLKRLKQLGICAQIFPTAEHTRYQHSIAVGQISRKFGLFLSRNVHKSAVRELDVEACKATPDELLQLELAGYAHDLGHGPYSHLWEKFMRQNTSFRWCHEEMSKKLLDIAVKEACDDFNLPPSHFLRNDSNIEAVKNMIKGNHECAPPEKAWLYSIVSNEKSGLDTDKMDYLLRDQHNVFSDKPCRFNATEQLRELMESARIIVNEKGKTEIAFDISCGTTFIERVNDIFQARAIMHEKVYQSGPVIAIEELIVKILSVVSPVFNFPEQSSSPEEFLLLDDAVFDEIRKKDGADLSKEQQGRLQQGKHLLKLLDQRLGPKHVHMSRKVPNTLLENNSSSDICSLIAERVMPAVWRESGTDSERVWVKVTDISEGRGNDKAVQYVTFFSADAEDLWPDDVEVVTTRFEEESLRSQYGLRIEEYHSARMCFCHLLYWKDSHEEADEMHVLWELFDKHWEDFKKEVEGGNQPGNKRKRNGFDEDRSTFVVPDSDSDHSEMEQ